MRAIRQALVVVACVGTLAGCARQPASTRRAIDSSVPEVVPSAAQGRYPRPPRVRQLAIRWTSSTKPDWHFLLRRKDVSSPGGHISLSLQWPHMVYVICRQVSADRGAEPNALVLDHVQGERTIIRRAPPGAVLETPELAYPWVCWVERSAEREWDWRIASHNLRTGETTVVARSDRRLGKRQFVPTIALERGLLAWDQRRRTSAGGGNVVRAVELATGRRYTVDASGLSHVPEVSDGAVFFNREWIRPDKGEVAVKSDVFVARPGASARRLTRTGFAMFASASHRTLAWLNLRRFWLSQPALADVYCRWKGGPALRVTDSGLVDRVEAGDELVAWQETPCRVSAVDLRESRGYRLAGLDGREALLCAVDGKRVAYELQPRPGRPEGDYELVIVQLTRNTQE